MAADTREQLHTGGRTSSRPVIPSRITELVNGFPALEELEYIRVSRHNISPWSIPQEALQHEPAESQVFQEVNGRGGKERRLHANRELEPEELELLQKLQGEARRQDVAFLPAVSVQATRWLGHAKGDHLKALEGMRKTNSWRLEFFGRGPIKDAQVAEDLNAGVLYFCGRDELRRPALIFRAARIPPVWLHDPDFTRLVRTLVFCMEYFRHYMAVPGKTENINLIVDVKGLSFAKALLQALQVVGRAMAKYYIGCMFKIRIVNMTTSLRLLANMARSVLSERTKQKLFFVEKVADLQTDFALHQLEEDLGGSLPVHETFFPFPLQPGPFDAGYAGGPDASAVPGLHAAISPGAMQGRLWDPAASREDNMRLKLTDEAPQLFERCGMKLPASFELERRRSEEASVVSDGSLCDIGDFATPSPEEMEGSSKALLAEHSLRCLVGLAAEDTDEEHEVQDAARRVSMQQPALAEEAPTGQGEGPGSCPFPWCCPSRPA